ncbi:MAG TPA: PHB depolymerase family esterase [Candidatus Binatia bacterium]
MTAGSGRSLRLGVLRLTLGASTALLFAVSVQAADPPCPPAPRPLCRELGQTALSIDAAAGRFDWSGSRGPATSLDELGQPVDATGYQVCAWDDGGLLVAAQLTGRERCDGSSCWRLRAHRAARYTDLDGANGFVHVLDLGASGGPAATVHALAVVDKRIALPVAGHLTVQLLRKGSPLCFESSIPARAFTINNKDGASAAIRLDVADPIPPLPSPGCTIQPPGYRSATTTTDGFGRTFRVHVPALATAGNPLPVVFLLHPGLGSGTQIESSSRMAQLADAEGFVLVAPDGTASAGGVRSWNAGSCCRSGASDDDDVAFFSAVLNHVEVGTCIDQRRVYAVGEGTGAMMAHRLACDLADRVTAIADVAGTDMTASCKPARPVPVLMIHGAADAVVPFGGGIGCAMPDVFLRPVADAAAAWVARDGCDAATAAASVAGDAQCVSWSGCASRSAVRLCRIPDGGHQWPGGFPASAVGLRGCPAGYQSRSFEASQSIWGFFASHPAS